MEYNKTYMNIQEENLKNPEIDKEIDNDPSFMEGFPMGNRIKYIKKILRTESHLWYLIDDKGSVSGHRVKIYFERKARYKNDKLVTFIFVGNSMNDAIAEAEKYVAQELAAGTLVDYSKK
jgi:hypothetical protein